jgi:hypothetical protein
MNPADQRFEGRYLKRLSALEKQMQDIKTAQRVGGDSLAFVDSIENSFAMPIGANSIWWRSLRFYGITGTLNDSFTSEVGIRFYIDNDNNENYRVPLGPSLTSGQRKCFTSISHDHREGAVGEKFYHIAFINDDSAAHTFYGHFILTLPNGAISS